MEEVTDDTCDVTAARLAAWAEGHGVPLDVMRARVAGNRAAIAATAALMARMVAEAGTGPAPDQAQLLSVWVLELARTSRAASRRAGSWLPWIS